MGAGGSARRLDPDANSMLSGALWTTGSWPPTPAACLPGGGPPGGLSCRGRVVLQPPPPASAPPLERSGMHPSHVEPNRLASQSPSHLKQASQCSHKWRLHNSATSRNSPWPEWVPPVSQASPCAPCPRGHSLPRRQCRSACPARSSWATAAPPRHAPYGARPPAQPTPERAACPAAGLLAGQAGSEDSSPGRLQDPGRGLPQAMHQAQVGQQENTLR